MRAFEFLSEKVKEPAVVSPEEAEAESPEIENLKVQLSAKIKELPTDPATMKLLQEIEDMLGTIGAGSRSQAIGNALQLIQDPDVNKAQKLLAKYFMSLDASPKDRQAMLQLWKSDKLINVDMIMQPGKHTIAQLVNDYENNPAVKEMTDDLSQIAALGQGKGEFLLSVFSKRITKAAKGDLAIQGVGTLEVKTTDVGAGRFMDQQVRPTSKYQGTVNDFKELFKEEIAAQKILTTTGISITGLIQLAGSLDPARKNDFKAALTNVVANIFPEAADLVGPIVDSITAGNASQAKQRYAVANLNNYMAQKTDDVGILVINLRKDPYTLVFFTDNASLNAGGMRLHSSTAYPVTDEARNAYPQTDIVDTKQVQEA